MKAQNDNAGKLANQVRKALRLASIVDAVMLAEGFDPFAQAEAILATLRAAPERQWATMAVGQGETPPSAETKALVLDVYAARVRALRLVPMLAPLARAGASRKRLAAALDAG